MASTIHVTTEDFESKVLRSGEPMVVDFWAEWCGPCRMMAPVLEQLADEMQGTVSFAKLNVDENPDLSARYEVEGIPTLLVFAQGKEVGRIVGFAPKVHIQHSLEQIISELEAQLDRSAA
jgi:thioredoxin 1